MESTVKLLNHASVKLTIRSEEHTAERSSDACSSALIENFTDACFKSFTVDAIFIY